MPYSSESSKWKAYQFSDPFAADSFYVLNKVNQVFCRPDCDARPISNLKSEISFVSTPAEAMNLGYHDCSSCDPLNSSVFDVNLLIKCVSHVNEIIGFYPPLVSDVENEAAKPERSKFVNRNSFVGSPKRALSIPVINSEKQMAKEFAASNLSKNDSDHYCLVDLACRHLALAAAMNFFNIQSLKSHSSASDDASEANSANGTSSPTRKRKRRGGVLGFKELAAKSKLSAWHFHRVFKSVTGLTPKTYGDKCSAFFKKYKESGQLSKFEITKRPSITSPIIAPMVKSEVAHNQLSIDQTLSNAQFIYETPISYPNSITDNASESEFTLSMPQVTKIKTESPLHQQLHGEVIPSSSITDFTGFTNTNNEFNTEILSTTAGNLFEPALDMLLESANTNLLHQPNRYAGPALVYGTNHKIELGTEFSMLGSPVEVLNDSESSVFPEIGTIDIPDAPMEGFIVDSNHQTNNCDDFSNLILI